MNPHCVKVDTDSLGWQTGMHLGDHPVRICSGVKECMWLRMAGVTSNLEDTRTQSVNHHHQSSSIIIVINDHESSYVN